MRLNQVNAWMQQVARVVLVVFVALTAAACATGTGSRSGYSELERGADQAPPETFEHDEVVREAEAFFGNTSVGLGQVLAKAFEENGAPSGYILGQEGSGALGVGVRYGSGKLVMKGAAPETVYWQGASLGFDAGGDASKVMVLIYDLPRADGLYGRYGGVEGTFYMVGGVGVHYLRGDGVTLAPVRAGVGLRGGVSLSALKVTRERSWMPL